MTPSLTLLHTARAHCQTFDALRDAIAPRAQLHHKVRTDWLTRARREGIGPELAAEVRAEVRAVRGPVLCTCATLGDTAVEAGALRIDQPMMARAAGSHGPILLVCALESTLASSRSLLQVNLRNRGNAAPVTTLVVEEFWPLFETGQQANFCAAIAAAAIEAVQARPDIATIVLAQASMADTAHLLDGLGPEVLTSPEPALRAALGLD
ncbi:MAG: hypothetical protein EP318_18285 [Rhodobacteraceae bacterium]|nr:MAG: hypothetical protein EP318_18285 [Paracoccaceae bacterium]